MNIFRIFLPMLSLIFVLALVIFAYTFILKRKKVFENKSGIVEITRHYMTSKSYISIAKIGDKYYSLGVSENNINKISELSEEEVKMYFSFENPLKNVSNFSEILKKTTKKVKEMKDGKNEKGQ